MSQLSHLKQIWSWNKYYYFSSFALTSLAGILFYSKIEVLEVITYPLMMFSLIFTFLCFQKDHFSIKYLQSLPLSKRELYHLKLGDTLISVIPLFFWGLVFQGIVLEMLTDSNAFSFENSFMLLVFYVLASLLISIWSFFRLYEFSRSPFVKGNPKTYNYQILKIVIMYFTGGMYSIYAFITSIYLLSKHAPQFLMELQSFLGPFKTTWSLIGIVAVFTWYEYHRVFRRWLEEKLSYIKFNWKPLRDVPIMVLALLSVIIPPAYVIHNSQGEFGKTNLLEATRSGNVAEVQKLLDQGTDINSKSNYGYTALMAAAHLGNEKMYFYLLSKGASKVGRVHKKIKLVGGGDINWLAIYGGNEAIVRDLFGSKNVNLSMNGSYPLHLAAYRCHVRVLDHLIELGANPNVKVSPGNKSSGKTPLHFATEKNCINGVISLVEAGADIEGIDYQKFRNKDLSYYLERKSRSPAGK